MNKILILDFGSQYTQLIARKVREAGVYCEIHPFNRIPARDADLKGVILSGSPSSVTAPDAPQPDLKGLRGELPLLGICYGAQWLAQNGGGEVAPAGTREYGRAKLSVLDSGDPLFAGIPASSTVWMSHGDTITRLPADAEVIGSTDTVDNAAFRLKGEPTWGIQFHPEVHHSEYGPQILSNFVIGICGCSGDWTPENFIEATVGELREKLGDDRVILGLSGGELRVGKTADIMLADLSEKYIIDSRKFLSKGKNTPFNGMEVYGRVKCTIVDGKVKFAE